MTGPRRVSASALAREVGVPQPTLSLWLKSAGTVSLVNDDDETKPRAKRPEDWTPQEKLSAVEEAASLSDADLGGWLRRKGLTEVHLRQWRDTALSGFSTRPSRAGREERKRVKELERELKRKDKALAETAALLVLQGKMQALWADEDDPTRQTNEEPSSRASRRRKKRGRD
jgi:hypothetical protein